MEVAVYSLCAFTSFICLGLLLREYRKNRARLLLWMLFCFFGLFLSNVVLILDRFLLPSISLALYRVLPTVLGFGALIYALTQEEG